MRFEHAERTQLALVAISDRCVENEGIEITIPSQQELSICVVVQRDLVVHNHLLQALILALT